MAPILIALGVLGAALTGEEPTNVTTPTERMIVVSRSSGFTAAAHTLDPTDVLDFEVDLAALLEANEEFTTIDIAVTATSAALGFTIPGSGGYAPVEVSDSRIRIWPQIAAEDQSDVIWANAGVACRFEITAETDSVPPRTWQRTAQITVAQK